MLHKKRMVFLFFGMSFLWFGCAVKEEGISDKKKVASKSSAVVNQKPRATAKFGGVMDSCGTQTVKRNLERKRSSKWPIAVKVTRAQKNDYIQRVRGKIQASGVGYPSEDAWRKKMVGLKAMQEKMEQIARDCRNLAEQNMERRSQACQNIKKVAFGL